MLSELNDSGEAVLRTLATDGGQHVEAVPGDTDLSVRTVHRAVESLGELVDLDNGTLLLTSEKIRQDVEALVESLQDVASSTAESIARLCRVETRSAADSALQNGCTSTVSIWSTLTLIVVRARSGSTRFLPR
jgi:ElaB/YqjD/DUF883 family membrane-anchored ribosome-binding protein